MSERVTPPTADWLAAMIRNYIEQDEALKDAGSVVVPAADDPLTIYVLQRRGEHLIVQVNRAELIVR